MKRTTIILFCLLSIFFCNAQNVCANYPTAKELINTLSRRPTPEISFTDFNEKCNMNSTIKKRLLYLLDWKWSKKEIDDYLKSDLIEHEAIYEIKKNAKFLSKGDTLVYKKLVDSLKNYWKSFNLKKINQPQISGNEESESLSSFFKVNDELILTVGYLNMYESVPILRKSLSDTLHYNINVIKPALARLGDKKLQTLIVKQYNYNPQINGQEWMNEYNIQTKYLFYINTQESISKLHHWLDTTKTFDPYNQNTSTYHCSSILVRMLKDKILNKDFQAVLSKLPDDLPFYDSKLISECKKWMLSNKGKYILSKN